MAHEPCPAPVRVLTPVSLQSLLYSQPCSSLGLFLLDNHRMSQLSLSTGKTKKKFPSLASIQPQLALTCSSPSGAFLAGLTTNGDLFVWHQPTEVLGTYQSPLSKPGETAGKVKGAQDFHGTLWYCMSFQRGYVWKDMLISTSPSSFNYA